MCGGGGGIRPVPIGPPAEAAPPPTPVNPEIGRARRSNRRRAALAAGRQSTIATSAQGLQTPASTAQKNLLGV